MAARGRNRGLAGLAALACAGGLAACPRPAPPPPPPPRASLITVGSVDSASEAAGPAAVDALRLALEAEAGDLGRDPRLARPLVVDGSISSFARVREGRRLTLRCEVSLSLRDRAGGRLLALPRGWVELRVGAPRDEAEAEALDREAVRDAVRSALARLEPVLADL